jgi:thioesterase domain-containing protein
MTGEIFFCRQMLTHLKTNQPILAIEPDTRSGGRTWHARIEEVAHQYVRAIRKQQPEGPYLIAGYSFGGVVAFELARQLTMEGQSIERLVLFDPNPPMIATTSDQWGDASDRLLPARKVRPQPSRLRFFKPSWWKRSKRYWRRSYWRLKYVLRYELLVRIRLHPPVSWRRCYTFWAAHWMGRRYRTKPTRVPAVLFRSEVRRNQGIRGWRNLCLESMCLIYVPGDHRSIFREPDVLVLARKLDRVLEYEKSGVDEQGTDSTNVTLPGQIKMA